MNIDSDTERAFLCELYNTTQGDPAVKTTMQAVGSAIGLDKEQAGKIAEELIGKGLVEIKTLSGGIGITDEGNDAARQLGAAPAASDPKLSPGPIVDAEDRQAVEMLLAGARQALTGIKADYAGLEEMVMDIKTTEVHLLSSKPKTAVIKELLRALQASLENAGNAEIAGRIKGAIGQK